VYVAFGAAPAAATYPHLARWYTHISALLGNRCEQHSRSSRLPAAHLLPAICARPR
jgi:hypothetical protein